MSSYHCTVKVKSGQAFKTWSNSQIWSKTGQRRGVYLHILIFLDVSIKLDYMIENELFRKLIQILFGDNLSDIFK